MTFVFRAARLSDLGDVYEMAKGTGGGFTNLPADRSKLESKLATAASAFSREDETIGNDEFFFVLEDLQSGKARGTCQIFSQIGMKLPFYNYKVSAFAKYSRDLDRTFSAEMLTLTTEYNGCSEVGGLFLHPAYRAAGAGGLLARARYLFICAHRERFADRTVAELRGVIDEAGSSPFWDGLAGRFFGMSFREADQHNAVHGNQFIADLAPRHPIYTSLLSEAAVHVMGIAHQTGHAAQRMLEKEGFKYESCIDIFDGGPTLAVVTDKIRTLKIAQEAELVAISDDYPTKLESIVTCGRLTAFRATYGTVAEVHGGITLDSSSANAIGASVGDRITHVQR